MSVLFFYLGYALGLARGDGFEIQRPGIEFREQASASWPLLTDVPSGLSRTDLSLEFALGDATWNLKLIPWAWAWFPSSQAGTTGLTRFRAEFKEAWLEFARPDFDIRIGQQVMGWGAADKINPTDVWNPLDLSDPFQSEKLAMPTLLVRAHPTRWESAQIEVVATPFFRPSELPVAFPEAGIVAFSPSVSRWLLPLPTLLEPSAIPLFYEMASPSYPATWQGAVRLRLVRPFEGWDFSFLYFNGVEKEPRLGMGQHGTASPTLPLTLVLNPSYHRTEVLGFDAAGSVTLFGSDFGIRAEAALYVPDNSRVATAPVAYQADLTKDRYVQVVAGLDHTFKKNVLGTVLYWNLQAVIRQRIDNAEIATGSNVVSGLPNFIPWDRDLVLYIEDRIGSKWKFSATVITGLKYGDVVVQPTLHHAFSDAIKAQLGAQFFGGSRSGFFGQNFEAHRILGQLSLSL